MKKLLIITFVFGIVALHGCDTEKTKDANSDEITTDQSLNQSVIESSDSTQQTISQPAEVTVGQPENPTDLGSTATGMNPAHGAPGHRCDIDVGAPMNSPPKKVAPVDPVNLSAAPIKPITTNKTEPATSPVEPQTIKVNPASVTTLPGMNPPHGKPGHDCAIAVGAPLKK